jgi:hypothetical protein
MTVDLRFENPMGRWSSSMDASLPRTRMAWLLLAVLVASTGVARDFAGRSAAIEPVPEYHLEGYDEYYVDGGGAFYDACGSCGSYGAPCCVGPVGAIWVHGEYLMWWTKGMETPPLVSAGPTGTLDDARTVVLFGDDDLLGQMRSGFRVRLGTWLDCEQRWAIEGEYWRLGGSQENFFASSDSLGNPAIYRPFFNVNPRGANDQFDPPARHDVELVAFPGALAGSVSVDASSQLQGSGLWLRHNLCCDLTATVACDPCFDPCSGPFGRRFDFLLGYRYVRLRDQLMIQENLTSLRSPPLQGEFILTDTFGASNDFHGAEIGLLGEFDHGRWSLELLGRLALGSVRQRVDIAGETVISQSEISDGTYPAGLLAQRTNRGPHSRNEFAVLPQLGATVGYRLTPRLQATVGYSFLYLSRVVRAAEQIDLDVNPDLLAPQATPFAGAMRPGFQFRDTDFWAQGMNFGLHFAW